MGYWQPLKIIYELRSGVNHDDVFKQLHINYPVLQLGWEVRQECDIWEIKREYWAWLDSVWLLTTHALVLKFLT